MVAYRTSALGVKLAAARLAMCAGFFTSSLFAFFSPLPHFSAPEIGQMSKRALGAVMVKQSGESDCVEQSGRGEEQMDESAEAARVNKRYIKSNNPLLLKRSGPYHVRRLLPG